MTEHLDNFKRRRVLQALGTSVVCLGGSSVGVTAQEDSDSEYTITFDALSTEAQRVFRTGFSNRKYTSRDSLPDQLFENDYVEYRGNLYQLNRRIQHIYLEKIVPTRKSTVPDGATVRSFAGLPAGDQQAFATAIEQGKHRFETGKHSFGSTDGYVEYHGDTYWLGHAHMNIPEYSISPEQI